MSRHKRMPTSAEVFAVIRARHSKDLDIYGSFSNPDGRFNGGPGEMGEMHTIYSLKGAVTPFIEARTTWTIDPEQQHKRIDENHEYWLCLPQSD